MENDILPHELARRTMNCVAAGEVQRFHAVPSIAAQSVGQHTYGVLVFLLGMRCFLDPEDLPLLIAALLHDAPELFTGDIPFTAKREVPELKTVLDKAELQYSMEHLFVPPRLTPRQQFLLHLADTLDGLRWSIAQDRDPQHTVARRWVKVLDDLLRDSAVEHLRSLEEFDLIWQLRRRLVEAHSGPSVPITDLWTRVRHQLQQKLHATQCEETAVNADHD